MMMSSTRFRNSGRKWPRNSIRTFFSISACSLSREISGAEIFLDDRRADVARHDDDGVLEIDRPPLPVGEAAVVEHLQQHVEDIVVRLFDFVEEHDRIRPAAHGFAELAAFLVADVARAARR